VTSEYPLLRSLDPYHQRLGYLNGVLLCAVRGLDSREALVARFYDMMFERIYESDPRWASMIRDANPSALAEAKKTASSKVGSEVDARDVLMPGSAAEQWMFAHDFWRVSQRVYSSKGGLTPEPDKVSRPVELAKWLGLLLPTYELAEEGVVIRAFLEETRGAEGEMFNPMVVRSSLPLRLLYLRSLLAAECLFPNLAFLLGKPHTEHATRGSDGLLRAAIADLLGLIGMPNRPDEILETQRVLEFNETILKSASTEENYLRPRMEILVDMGLLDREGANKSKSFPWQPNECLSRAAAEWSGLRARTESISAYLDHRFFGSMAKVYGLVARPIHPQKILGLFCAAYELVGREFGFTPARTVATVACVKALQQSQVAEVAQVMEAVQSAAAHEEGRHLQFSGGSRFDDEFLIRVDPAAMY